MVKQTLDALYISWTTDKSDAKLTDLLEGVRQHAKTNSGGRSEDSEDFAQQITMTVWRNLAGFQQHTSTAFGRWVSVIMKHERLKRAAKRVSTSTEGLVEQAVADDSFIDVADLPSGMKEVAVSLLCGYSLKETAQRSGVKEGTLRKRVHSFRNGNEMLHKTAI